jgi:hypothetical protein
MSPSYALWTASFFLANPSSLALPKRDTAFHGPAYLFVTYIKHVTPPDAAQY